MPEFLIDVNLPYYFGLWNTPAYVHQIDIDPRAKDKVIWEYAKRKNLTIITKDSDFSNRIVLQDPPPKVICIRMGNMDMQVFHHMIHKCWEDVLKMSETHKLVNVYQNTIEGLN